MQNYQFFVFSYFYVRYWEKDFLFLANCVGVVEDEGIDIVVD
jgi:hypothetical protein